MKHEVLLWLYDVLVFQKMSNREPVFSIISSFSLPKQQTDRHTHTHKHTHTGHLRTKLNLLQINANSIKDNSYLDSNLKRRICVFSFLFIHFQMFFFKTIFFPLNFEYGKFEHHNWTWSEVLIERYHGTNGVHIWL